MLKITLFLITLVCVAPLKTALASPPKNFNQAKKVAWKLYAPDSTEFYCGCKYTGNKVDLASCGYKVRKNSNRASRIEWEHIVPAWNIGHQRQCWQQGGRKNCTKTDTIYQKAEADLFNLVPSIGEINGDRSNYRFAWLPQPANQYGQCQTVIDFKAKKVMPRAEVRGVIARTYFYMNDKYQLKLSKQDTKLFEAWNKAYPASAWETKRNQKIACVMGWGNKYVSGVNLKQCSL